MKTKTDLIVNLLVRHVKANKLLFKSYDFSNKLQKYSIKEYFIEIMYVLKTGIAWRHIRSHINWNSIYKNYIKLNEHNIFELSYIQL